MLLKLNITKNVLFYQARLKQENRLPVHHQMVVNHALKKINHIDDISWIETVLCTCETNVLSLFILSSEIFFIYGLFLQCIVLTVMVKFLFIFNYFFSHLLFIVIIFDFLSFNNATKNTKWVVQITIATLK